VAAGAAVGLFLSIYLHELGHAVVAARFGLETRRITLFVLGGLAEMAAEPKSARAEFWIAVAGPLVSLALGAALLSAVAFGFADAEARAQLVSAPGVFLASLGPLASLALWLGNVNLVLGLFNLIPAFPLDGGRLFRAAVWALTGDGLQATRWASAAGRWLGWSLTLAGAAMLLGIHVPLFGRGLGGLWLGLIGWFVLRAAGSSIQHAELQACLGNASVGQLMQRHFGSVESCVSVRALVEGVAVARNQTTVPVLANDGVLLGLVTPGGVALVPRGSWEETPAGDVMTPLKALPVAYEDDVGMEALQALMERGAKVLPVVDGQGRCVGLFDREQAQRWRGADR
jgi:Zn-dependent protease/CBS domain-containing protein